MKKIILSAAVLVLLAACVQLQREHPQKDFFSIEAQRPETSAAPARFDALRVEPLQIAPAYAGKTFVYRTGELQYEEDYYNRFFGAPAQRITEATVRWLRDTGLFRTVYLRPAPVEPSWHLSGTVEALYGDWHRQPAQAVLAISFELLHEQGGMEETALRREYRQAVPLATETPAALAAGWSAALAEILRALEADLRQLPAD